MREVIDRAASLITVPGSVIAFVFRSCEQAGGGLCWSGTPPDTISAWKLVADVVAQVYGTRIVRCFRPATAGTPHMFDDLWTVAKSMYKVELTLADGARSASLAPPKERSEHRC